MKKKTKPEIAYHFTSDKLRDGRSIPAVGEWLEETGELRICEKGLHASRTPFQALSFAPGFKLHKVEVREIVAETDDKLVARQRKILMTIDAKDLILSFARKQALSVCHLFDCPPVLKKWLETGDESIRAEARDAAAAYASDAAAYAADAADAAANAAYASDAAAYAADAADADAAYAVYAANAAAYAAPNAAYAAAAYAADAANAAYAANAAANKKKATDLFNKEVKRAFKAQR